MTGRPWAARQMRLALVVTSDWKLIERSTIVSTSWAWMTGPSTTTTGSLGKIGVPSFIAQTLQENLKSRR